METNNVEFQLEQFITVKKVDVLVEPTPQALVLMDCNMFFFCNRLIVVEVCWSTLDWPSTNNSLVNSTDKGSAFEVEVSSTVYLSLY
jgi:hypothetical protein